MECKVCGRKSSNENANFCDYCGTSFREHMNETSRTVGSRNPFQENPPGKLGSQEEKNQTAGTGTKPMNPLETVFGGETMSFVNWLAVFAVIFIPYIGILLFLGLLIYWSVARTAPASKKNFARAALIFCVVLFFLYLTVMSVFLSSIENPEALLQNLLSYTK